MFYGNSGAGFVVNPRQRQADDSKAIAHLGISDSTTSFRLAATGRSAFGRGKVKLQYEVEELGVPFDNTPTGSTTSWQDSGTNGVSLNELVSGLTASKSYHWRLRVLYNPVTTPLQPAGPWLTMPWNGWTEKDLRTKN